MSGRVTVYGAGELLMSFFAKSAEPPQSFWLALIRQIAPTPYSSGLELDEPDAEDYARVEIVNDYEHWRNDSQPHEVTNFVSVQFTTAVSDWGEVRYWALCNSAEGGFCYFVGDLENPVLIEVGDAALVTDGDLGVSLGPFFLVEEED